MLNFQKYNLSHIFQVINIVVGDGLPKFICTDCQGVINKFTDFCNMVQDVQKRLEEEKLDFSQVRKFLSLLHAQFEAKKIQWERKRAYQCSGLTYELCTVPVWPFFTKYNRL